MTSVAPIGAHGSPLTRRPAAPSDRPSDRSPEGSPPLPAWLPPLRTGLQLHPAAPHRDGSPAWTVQDPVSNQFLRIGWLEFELLLRWDLGSPQAVLEATARETPLAPTADELAALCEILLGQGLLQCHDPAYLDWLRQRQARAQAGRLTWLLHHYLFFRVPLVHPAARLARLASGLAWLFTPAAAAVVLACGMLGLLLSARRFDELHATFLDTLSWSGLGAYLVALAITKSVHELGHALVATRAGLRVAHMGVAFVVMWPMLYTDTSESWRLARPRQRLAIASAGVGAELTLAILATLGWHLATDGSALQQGLFYLATTGWVVSLALNASPFMRFDGYFVLSDLLDIPNLHERSFALGRAALRRALWGWPDPDPENFEPGLRRALIAFALVTWVVRLVVFLGIAVAVYLFFFKALGVFLMAVELAWFVVRPVWREVGVWMRRRDEIPTRRRWFWGGVGGLMAWLLLWPWQAQVHAPAWAQPVRSHVFHTPLPARMVAAEIRAPLAEGAVAFELDQPDIAYRAELGRVASAALTQRLRGLAGEERGEERRALVQQQQALREAEQRAQLVEAERLLLRAPFAGVLIDVDPELAPGVWVSPRQPLAVLVDPSDWQAEAYVSQQAIERLRLGDPVRFRPEGAGPEALLSGRVVALDGTRTSQLPHALLATRHGGPLQVLPDATGLTPRDPLYRVRIALEQGPAGLRVQRGEVVIDGRAESLLLDWLKPAAVVVLRELGV